MVQYILYYSKGASSLSIHALLCSLNIDCELIHVDINTPPLPEELFQYNPRGQIPVLVKDGLVIKESLNIALYLCETYDSPLLPKTPEMRRHVLEWLAFYTSNLHQSYATYFLMKRQLKSAEAQQEACLVATKRISYLWKHINNHLAETNYLTGNSITIADIFHTVIANWSSIIPEPITLGEHTLRLCKQVIQEPYMQQALQEEDLQYRITE